MFHCKVFCNSLLKYLNLCFLQEYIIDKLKKIGGFTQFNILIMNEMEVMYNLLNDMKGNLTVSD